MKQVRTTRHQWLIACDANMCPEDFEESLWFQNRQMFIKAQEEAFATCRAKGPHGELNQKMEVAGGYHTRQSLLW